MNGRLSIKLTLTLWFTAFMAITAGLCLGLILITSGQVPQKEAASRLDLTVRESISQVGISQGNLSLEPGFRFYRNEVYLLLYNSSGAMLTGQTPPDFPVDAALENGVTKEVSGDGESFYIFDLWIPSGWEDGIWLRGVTQSPDGSQMLGRIFTIFFLIMPFIILFAAVGGYLIARRALRPIKQITQTAESISEGRDLSRRLGLKAGNDEVGRLANAFDQMSARLEQAFETEKQFTSDASHELRTPTAVILAQCSYMEKYADKPEDYQEGVSVIRRQAEKMSLLINQLLDMTRLDFGTRKLQTEDIDFSAFLTVLCEEEDTGLRGIRMETQIAPGLHASIDPALFARVVQNLLENARKYGRENGWIQVTLRREDAVFPHGRSDSRQGKTPLQQNEAAHPQNKATLRLDIEDNGIGISQEDLARIWQRFYQVNPSRESGSGLGLGLSMVRQIVQLHGGTAEAESVLGKGSCFTIRLPLLESGQEKASSEKSPPAAPFS